MAQHVGTSAFGRSRTLALGFFSSLQRDMGSSATHVCLMAATMQLSLPSYRRGSKLTSVGHARASEKVKMSEFYRLFCEIDSLCAQGKPNFLGWIVIVIAVVFVVFLVLKYFGIIRSVD